MEDRMQDRMPIKGRGIDDGKKKREEKEEKEKRGRRKQGNE
jgi:hypothetical protein